MNKIYELGVVDPQAETTKVFKSSCRKKEMAHLRHLWETDRF